MKNLIKKAMLPFLFSGIISSQSLAEEPKQNEDFLPKTYVSFSTGIYWDANTNIQKRYGSMPGFRGAVIREFLPSLVFEGGLALTSGRGSFKKNSIGLEGESILNYLILDGGVYYSQLFEGEKNLSWFFGGGLTFSQINERAKWDSYYGSGAETNSGNNLGLKIVGGIEWKDGYVRLSVNPSSGNIDTTLSSFEFGWKWDVDNKKK